MDGKKGMEFNFIRSDGQLSATFLNSEYVTQKDVVHFADEIEKNIKLETNSEKLNIFIISLLSDEQLAGYLSRHYKDETPETLTQAQAALVKLRQAIFNELKKRLPNEQFLQITKRYYGQVPNNVTFLEDEKQQKQVYKDSKFIKTSERKSKFRHSLEKLKQAVQKLNESGKSIPYIVSPINIDTEKKATWIEEDSVAYTVGHRDFITLDKLLNKDDFKTILIAITDCLKGAKFLSENDLTLTDISLENMGFDEANGHGLMFDLDGLLETNTDTDTVVERNYYRPEFVPPEYRQCINGKSERTTPNSKSMIWSIGNILKNISILYLQSPDLTNLAESMILEKPEDRPDFHICIAEIEKIINEQFTELK